MARRSSRLSTYLLCAGIAVALPSCERGNKVGLPTSTLTALNSIYQASSGRLRNLKVDVDVSKGGTVEVAMQGQITENPGGEGEIWIPALIVKKLPPYFQIVEPSDSSDMSLEAYEFKGGQWCIALVMKAPSVQVVSAQNGQRPRLQQTKVVGSESSRDNSNQYQEGGLGTSGGDLVSSLEQEMFPPQTLKFKIELTAPEFSNNLPLRIPAQTDDPVTISVNLPQGAHFSQSEVALDMTTAPHWREKAGSDFFEQAQTTRPQALTNIPSALAGKGPRVAATLYSSDAVAWDLSPVTFSPPGFFAQFKIWFLPSALLLVLCSVSFWVRADRLAGFKSWLKESALSQQKLVEALKREVQDMSEFWSEVMDAGEAPAGLGRKWDSVATAITTQLDMLPFGRLYPVEDLNAKLDKYKFEVEKLKSPTSEGQLVAERALAHLVLLNERLQALAELNKRFYWIRTRSRSWGTAFWILAALAVVCAVFLLGSLARAQGAFQPSAGLPPKFMLCDLDVELLPLDTLGRPEKINVTLKFSSLSMDRKQNTSTFQIGSGRSSVTMEPVSPPVDNKVLLIQHSNNLITLKVPTSYSPILHRIQKLSQSLVEYKVPSGYPHEMATANQLSFSYTMSGAEAVHNRFAGIHWLYRFPFDFAEVSLPIDVRQAALLSHLELQKPASDYFAHVTVEGLPTEKGLPVDLSESENGDRYNFANADPMVRTPVWAGQTVTLRATFQRTLFQSWGLIAMVLFFGIVGGAFTGYITKLPEKSWKAYVLTALSAGSLVFIIRTAVLNAYKDLPTLLVGRGTTIFELAFLLALVLMVAAIFITRKIVN